MTCWEILGIEPTTDQHRIRQAYEQQMKFASGDEAARLDQAFRDATGQAPAPTPTEERREQSAPEARPLDGNDGQVVREVVLQIKALLNDSRRSQDVGIWQAILCEPPADQEPVRAEIARQLEPQIRPMAENGSLSSSVANFLGNWFEWSSLQGLAEPRETAIDDDSPDNFPGEADQSPQLVNFWPAVIGWIVGLAVLAMLFGGMGGGG